MSKIANSANASANRAAEEQLEAEDEGFKPLTREEAQKLREENPSVSSWAVLAGQLLVGVLVALAAWGLTGKQSAGWSSLYGALAVVIPGALFVRGLTSKVSSMNPGAAVVGFFLWEAVKIALTLAMLFAAPRLVENLSWPAMLAGLIVTMKAYWGVLWFKPRRPNTQQT
ncbi:ATP synthase subunit I [Polaromonas sp.]|uniref:ATP synthase subunit I n=1 Tax=Polaromonas sp. TaxID=1869339 RepID=UPI001802B207|nr:ATP synthase subunit I [Polaromonas sp.]NML86658.1 ATP synthase subunit I [Polaromonas sp.]